MCFEKSDTDGAECSRKVVSGRRVVGTIRSLVNAKDWSLSVLESCIKYFLYSFLCMVVKQCYGRRDLELGLNRWTTSDIPPVMEENPQNRYGQRLGGDERLQEQSKYIHVKQE